jgi:hypothetical protein
MEGCLFNQTHFRSFPSFLHSIAHVFLLSTLLTSESETSSVLAKLQKSRICFMQSWRTQAQLALKGAANVQRSAVPRIWEIWAQCSWCCFPVALLRYMKTRVMRHEEILEDAEGNFVGYDTVGVMLAAETHQMQESPAALCMLDSSIALVRKSFCWMRKQLFECDGASNYHSFFFMVGALYVARWQGGKELPCYVSCAINQGTA